MSEKIKPKAVAVLGLFVIFGIYFIINEEQIVGIVSIATGISLITNISEVIKWMKELFSLFKQPDDGENGGVNPVNSPITGAKSGDNSPIKQTIINIIRENKKKKRKK